MSKSNTFEYPGQGFKVSYDKDVCSHSGVCVRNLPSVFDTKKRPWVDTAGASAEEIKKLIARCPSGALKFHSES